jgi:hypothetical protein
MYTIYRLLLVCQYHFKRFTISSTYILTLSFLKIKSVSFYSFMASLAAAKVAWEALPGCWQSPMV